jgi:hypothetical protein
MKHMEMRLMNMATSWMKEVADQEYNGDFWLFMKILNGELE